MYHPHVCTPKIHSHGVAGPPSNEQVAESISLLGEEQPNVMSSTSATGKQNSSTSVHKKKGRWGDERVEEQWEGVLSEKLESHIKISSIYIKYSLKEFNCKHPYRGEH